MESKRQPPTNLTDHKSILLKYDGSSVLMDLPNDKSYDIGQIKPDRATARDTESAAQYLASALAPLFPSLQESRELADTAMSYVRSFPAGVVVQAKRRIVRPYTTASVEEPVLWKKPPATQPSFVEAKNKVWKAL